MTSVNLALKRRIKLYGHRGARGLAPENTLPAYKTALAIGVDVVDMDIAMTKDGVLVVTHDPHLNPDLTRDLNGAWIKESILIKNLTLEELQFYDVGRIKPNTTYSNCFPDQRSYDHTPIPTLREVVQYVNTLSRKKVNFQIEIKTNPAQPYWTASPKELAQETLHILHEEQIEHRTEIQSFDWRALLTIQEENSIVKTAYLTDCDISEKMTSSDTKMATLWSSKHLLKNYGYSLPTIISELGGKIWGPEIKECSPEKIKEAHKLGLKVVTWTANTTKEIIKAIACNVDGIITDRPDSLRKIMKKQGFPLPPSYLI